MRHPTAQGAPNLSPARVLVQKHQVTAHCSRGPADATDWEQRSEMALRTRGWGGGYRDGRGWGCQANGVLTVEKQDGTPVWARGCFHLQSTCPVSAARQVDPLAQLSVRQEL